MTTWTSCRAVATERHQDAKPQSQSTRRRQRSRSGRFHIRIDNDQYSETRVMRFDVRSVNDSYRSLQLFRPLLLLTYIETPLLNHSKALVFTLCVSYNIRHLNRCSRPPGPLAFVSIFDHKLRVALRWTLPSARRWHDAELQLRPGFVPTPRPYWGLRTRLPPAMCQL